MSVDVWRSSGLQSYIFQRFACKIPRAACKSLSSQDANFTEIGKAEQGRTKDDKLAHNIGQSPNSTMPKNKAVHENSSDDGGIDHVRDAAEICKATEIKQQRLYSDNPAVHFLPSFSRIMAEGYCPTLMDILSLRVATTGTMRQP